MKEHRYTSGVLEVRKADDGMTIVGHASVFDNPYELWGFNEQVARGAFAKTIAEADVRALWNHDPNVVLGRNKSGTLRLSEDDTGLRYEIDLPETQAARDLFTLIQRGDVSQSSFAFEVVREEWLNENDERALPLRVLKELKLYDVSPVTYPAAEATDVEIKRAFRSLAEVVGRDLDDLLQDAKHNELRISPEGPESAAPPDASQAAPPEVTPAPDRTRQALAELDVLVIDLHLEGE